jgi:hypothetical protein
MYLEFTVWLNVGLKKILGWHNGLNLTNFCEADVRHSFKRYIFGLTNSESRILKCQIVTREVPSKSSRTDSTENSCSHYIATKQMIQLATLADFIRSYKNAILTVMTEMLFCTCICNTHHCKQGVSNLLALTSHNQLSNDHLSRIIRNKINRSYLSTCELISKAYKVTHAFISDILLLKNVCLNSVTRGV